MPDIPTLFPEDKPEQPIFGLTTSNFVRRLVNEPCRHCRTPGRYTLFKSDPNNGIGLICTACGRYHPLLHRRVMWLSQEVGE